MNADFEKKPVFDCKYLDCSEECKNIIFETDVPFCSPTIGARWMNNFGKYLTDNEANLCV